jgi:hypothetical protein
MVCLPLSDRDGPPAREDLGGANIKLGDGATDLLGVSERQSLCA